MPTMPNTPSGVLPASFSSLRPPQLQQGSLLSAESLPFHKAFLRENYLSLQVVCSVKAIKLDIFECNYRVAPVKLWNHTALLIGNRGIWRGTDINASTSSTIVLKVETREKITSNKVVSRLLHLLDRQSIHVDSNAYARLLQLCVNANALRDGKMVHAHIIKTGFEMDIYLENNLITMYGKLDSIVYARQVFDKMPERNIVSWTAMISGYARSGQGVDALELFCEMQQIGGVQPNEFTFTSVLGACISLEDIERGKQVQVHIIKGGSDLYIYANNALVDMYAKCGSTECARQVFDKMLKRDMVSWNTMIAGYMHNGQGEEAIVLFCEMQRAGIKPEQYAFSSVLMAIATLSALEEGKHVHACIIKTGLESDVIVGNALVTMYAKCGSIEDASNVFENMTQRDVISWTAMIAGYAQHGQVEMALQLFEQMPEHNSVSCSAMITGLAQNLRSEEALDLFCQMQQVGIESTHFTFASVLNACANLASIQGGRQMHGHIVKTGFESWVCIGSALSDMYAKCGTMVEARRVFDDMPERNMVSWTGMITGYAQNEQGDEALDIFCKMQRENIRMDRFTLASVLGACGTLAVLGEGKRLHSHILKSGLESDVGVGNALVTMYTKCGNMEDAREMFYKIAARDVVSWNAMIAGYAQHGRGKEALQFFKQMQQAGIKPNDITFVGVLSACNHVDLLDEGCNYFDSMSRDYGIPPRVEHYACMIGILGRAQRLDEAEDLINEMPFEPSVLVWRTLLSACRTHGNIELGRRAAERIIELEPQNPAMYALVSNIYASAGQWDDAAKVRRVMKNRGVKKLPARSWIVNKNIVHSFVVRDRSHPQIEQINAKLDELIEQVKKSGYVPDTSFVSQDVEPQLKEYFLVQHSEKLVVALGLLTTPPRTPIRIVKNIRVCGDCHTFTKFISKIVGREIVLRDGNCFHYFKDGFCSCGDYW